MAGGTRPFVMGMTDGDQAASSAPSSRARPFRILTVCTGNICRSPLAEQALAVALSDSLVAAFGPEQGAALSARVSIRSAGIAASDGQRMTDEALAEAARLGADGRMHLAHRLRGSDIERADLVLAMAREHRSAAVSLDPRSARRVFTLTEFVRLVTTDGTLEGLAPFDGDDLPAFFRDLVARISASRGYVLPPDSESELDITDPYGRSPRVYARVGSVIGAAAATLASTVVTVMRDP